MASLRGCGRHCLESFTLTRAQVFFKAVSVLLASFWLIFLHLIYEFVRDNWLGVLFFINLSRINDQVCSFCWTAWRLCSFGWLYLLFLLHFLNSSQVPFLVDWPWSATFSGCSILCYLLVNPWASEILLHIMRSSFLVFD